jgi:hypothetical protein
VYVIHYIIDNFYPMDCSSVVIVKIHSILFTFPIIYPYPLELRGCRGRDHMVVGFTMQMQLEPNTTNIVSSNLAQMRCALYDTK